VTYQGFQGTFRCKTFIVFTFSDPGVTNILKVNILFKDMK